MFITKQTALRTAITFCLITLCIGTVMSQQHKKKKPYKTQAGIPIHTKSKFRTANFVLPTSDGGYIITGNQSTSNNDTTEVVDLKGDIAYYQLNYRQGVWVRKINKAGQKEWEKVFTGYGSDNGNCIQETKEGGYILAGAKAHYYEHFKSAGSIDALVMKLSRKGAVEWEKLLGGDNTDFANYITPTNDSGYIFCGYSESSNGDVKRADKDSGNAWIVKVNKTGIIEWQQLLGYHNTGRSYSIKQLKDGSYLATGFTSKPVENSIHEQQDSFVSERGILLFTGHNYGLATKISANGNIVWQKLIGDSVSNVELFDGIKTNDNGAILAGTTRFCYKNKLNDPYQKVLLVKLDSMGNPVWQKTWADTGNIHRTASNIVNSKDGGYIVSGKVTYKYPDTKKYYDSIEIIDIKGNLVGYDVSVNKEVRYKKIVSYDYIAKADSNGNLIWQKKLEINTSFDGNNSLQKTADGNYIFMGNKRNKNKNISADYLSPYFIKFNDAGKIIWQKELDK